MVKRYSSNNISRRGARVRTSKTTWKVSPSEPTMYLGNPAIYSKDDQHFMPKYVTHTVLGPGIHNTVMNGSTQRSLLMYETAIRGKYHKSKNPKIKRQLKPKTRGYTRRSKVGKKFRKKSVVKKTTKRVAAKKRRSNKKK